MEWSKTPFKLDLPVRQDGRFNFFTVGPFLSLCVAAEDSSIPEVLICKIHPWRGKNGSKEENRRAAACTPTESGSRETHPVPILPLFPWANAQSK